MSTSKITGYRVLGGKHPETATIQKILTFHQVLDSTTDGPFSEALLFGIGGGIGSGYDSKSIKGMEIPFVDLGFKNNWQKSHKFVKTICDRLNLTYKLNHTKNEQKADKMLFDAILANQPVAIWIDKSTLPYYTSLPKETFEWVVNVVGIDGNVVTIDDVSKRNFPITHDLLKEARSKIGSVKNRALYISGAKSFKLETAVKKGLKDTVSALSGKSSKNSLNGLEEWADLLVNNRKKYGWPSLYSNRAYVYVVLEGVYESITHRAGGNLRNLYADFLNEASAILNNKDLKAVAKLYKSLYKDWIQLGDFALNDSVKDFKEAKELISERYELFYKEGPDAHKDIERISTRLKDIMDKNSEWLPLSDEEILQLYTAMSVQVQAIHSKEVEALNALKKAI